LNEAIVDLHDAWNVTVSKDPKHDQCRQHLRDIRPVLYTLIEGQTEVIVEGPSDKGREGFIVYVNPINSENPA